MFIGVLLPKFDLLPIAGTVVARWTELAETGADVFDLQLVATMLENGIRRIYTYNRSDFEPFTELDIVTP